MEVKHATCSADKIRKYFGYQTRYTLSDSVEEMINYIRDRGVSNFEYHLELEIINDATPRTWKERLF